jgi:ketosteroid isomerase-like protein
VTAVADGVFLWKASWPHLRHCETQTISQGDRVRVETVWLGAQTGPLSTPDGQTPPPTGKETVNPAAMVVRVHDDAIAEVHHYFDLAKGLAE